VRERKAGGRGENADTKSKPALGGLGREALAQVAKQTLDLCANGAYVSKGGNRVKIGEALKAAKLSTVLYSPETPPNAARAKRKSLNRFEVRNETTFSALARLSEGDPESHVGCLNFASAKNPGGGFLKGAMAQEEALAYASGLYPCLLQATDFYSFNRANASSIYLDHAIYSGRVPFFRDDSGALLDSPVLASVITVPAPNAGAVAQNEPQRAPMVEPALRRRAELVLRIAESHQIDHLVLGAWGCGVFRNDPKMVAKIFSELLKPGGSYASAFKSVTFAVFDASLGKASFNAFAERFRTTGDESQPVSRGTVAVDQVFQPEAAMGSQDS
jgi:uncharacterized protein (TIGR02452 family)